MSVDEEKKFVIKHTFIDVKNMETEEEHYGNKEAHFNIPWSIYMFTYDSSSKAYLKLECNMPCEESDWSIDMTVEAKVLKEAGEVYTVANNHVVSSQTTKLTEPLFGPYLPLADYLIEGDLTIECHVTINKVTGIELPVEKHIFKSFYDESEKEFVNIVLVVKGQKFYVNKIYLAARSTYFDSLFFGNSDGSEQSEVELEDVDPYSFQKFLEVLHGDPDINERTVKGILKLADKYNARMAIDKCERFFLNDWKLSLKEKFLLAFKYNWDTLKEKCLEEFDSYKEILSIILDNRSQFDTETFNELLNLCFTF